MSDQHGKNEQFLPTKVAPMAHSIVTDFVLVQITFRVGLVPAFVAGMNLHLLIRDMPLL